MIKGTWYTERLSRQLQHGLDELKKAGQQKKYAPAAWKTFYLLKDGRILDRRELRWLGDPPYFMSGSMDGLLPHQLKIKTV